MSLESFSSPSEQHESAPEKEPWEMTFTEFKMEYDRVMASVAAKEKIGHLDPADSAHVPISAEEAALLTTDWKAFSRSRGFSEEDIAEYERWLTLSGQRDMLPNAVNDPWRRSVYKFVEGLYVRHIDAAVQSGKTISPTILAECEALKVTLNPLQSKQEGQQDQPSNRTSSETVNDVW